VLYQLSYVGEAPQYSPARCGSQLAG